MTNLRFASVRDLYAAFPTAAIDVGEEVSDEPSAEFIRRVAASEPRAALAYCSYLLGRREAVWWACRCVRQTELRGQMELHCLEAAEAWVWEPTDARRAQALELGTRAPGAAPATWVARAASWAGGIMALGANHYVAPPPHLAAQAVCGAMLLAIGRAEPARRSEIQSGWIEAGLRFASGDFEGA